MAMWTDKDGRLHVVTRDGSHYVQRGDNYVKAGNQK